MLGLTGSLVLNPLNHTNKYNLPSQWKTMKTHYGSCRCYNSQKAIQNQIDSLTQQTTAARWYNSQLATELLSGRPNSGVRTVATTPGLPWEPEMTADQAAYVCTILHAKNILPTIGASSSNQLFNVSHPPENLEIHPPDPPKSQIPTFQQAQVLAMPVLGEQPTNPNLVFIEYQRDFYSQAPTGPYLSVPSCSVCGYIGYDRYECLYIAFGFNAPRLSITVAQAQTVPVVPTTTVVQPRTIPVVPNTTVVPAHTVSVVPTKTVARKAVTLPVYKEGKCATTHIHRFVNALALNGEIDELIKIPSLAIPLPVPIITIGLLPNVLPTLIRISKNC